MRHGSLFSGIGGFDLAAQWMNWENVFHCELMPFQRKILKYYWPNAIAYEDIRKTDFTIHRGQIDIVSGGFPCQPFSNNGKRLGKDDERHLWPEMLRAIQEIQPSWIVGENVHGIIDWNEGMVFEEVQTDLEAQGYEVQAFVLAAASINAPHQRYRVFFIAHTNSIRLHKCKNEFNTNNGWVNAFNDITENDVQGNSTNTKKKSFNRPTYFEEFPTQPPICGRDDGIPSRLDDITFQRWRRESIKGYGNAVVPQLVLQIFKAIEQYDNS